MKIWSINECDGSAYSLLPPTQETIFERFPVLWEKKTKKVGTPILHLKMEKIHINVKHTGMR